MLKKSKKQIISELHDEIQNLGELSIDQAHMNGDTVIQNIENYIKLCAIKAAEVIINNAYCQEDFEKDMGVRDEHKDV